MKKTEEEIYPVEGLNTPVNPFRIHQGLKYCEDDDVDWLKNLPIGTVFLARNKNENIWELLLFRIVMKTRFSIYLETVLYDNMEHCPVVSARFCRKYDLHEILELGIE